MNSETLPNAERSDFISLLQHPTAERRRSCDPRHVTAERRWSRDVRHMTALSPSDSGNSGKFIKVQTLRFWRLIKRWKCFAENFNVSCIIITGISSPVWCCEYGSTGSSGSLAGSGCLVRSGGQEAQRSADHRWVIKKMNAWMMRSSIKWPHQHSSSHHWLNAPAESVLDAEPLGPDG